MTTTPLSDEEIEELKRDVKYRADGSQFDLFRMLDAVPRLIAEIETARKVKL